MFFGLPVSGRVRLRWARLLVLGEALTYGVAAAQGTAARQVPYTWQQYYETVRPHERVGRVQAPVHVAVRDERSFQENGFDLPTFTRLLRDSLVARRSDPLATTADTAAGIPGVESPQVNVVVSYLGLYETESGNWGAKAVLRVVDPAGDAPIGADVLRGHGRPRDERLRSLTNELYGTLLPRLLGHLDSLSAAAGVRFRRIAAFGKAPLVAGATDEQLLQNAILDALREGASRGWGVQLSSTTTVVDFGAANVETRASQGALVPWYRVVPEYTARTNDGFLCVLVEAVVADPSRLPASR